MKVILCSCFTALILNKRKDHSFTTSNGKIPCPLSHGLLSGQEGQVLNQAMQDRIELSSMCLAFHLPTLKGIVNSHVWHASAMLCPPPYLHLTHTQTTQLDRHTFVSL